jgi:uroporphyrin-III C-methyltransferase / precorrin-2 dehydrogenase / sirohydrochlorin ferrochelatase
MSAEPQSSAASTPPLFPLFADLRGRAVLVVGGGVVARRKVEALLEAGAEVTLGTPDPEPALLRWIERRRVRWLRGTFEVQWLDDAWFAVAASRDPAVNRAVVQAAEARRMFVNAVDDVKASSVHVPARLRRGRLQIAISSGGTAPVLARRLRERLEAELDDSLTALSELFARERARIRRRFPEPGKRRRFFEQLLDGALPDLLRAGAGETAQAVFERALQTDGAVARRGSVTLVGAGPGDPALLTLAALRALNDADVILHDRLIGPGILELARRDAGRIDVGKRVGEDHDATQARIHALMLQHARAGKRVVRLQGGDPLVFGRGGEELDFLRAHAIAHRVIPGITAALACAAAAGVPLTDRRSARSVTLLSPRGSTSLDETALAAPGQTLAIYMGVGELEALAQSLIRHGRGVDTPCVLIENGSLPNQRTLAGTLADLPALARAHHVGAPALLIVGEVAAAAGRQPALPQAASCAA